jgi:hypothetical protein
MSSAPMTKAQRATKKAAQLKLQMAHTYGVVWPDGRVSTHVVLPVELESPLDGDKNVGRSRGDSVLQFMMGKVRIRTKFEDKGCRFLSEVCKADGCPEKHDTWLSVIEAREKGYKVQAKAEDIYPPTVMRLRSESDRGIIGGVVFVVGRGLVAATQLNEEEREAAKLEEVADKLESMGLGRPAKEDAEKAKKGAKSNG